MPILSTKLLIIGYLLLEIDGDLIL